MELLRIWIGSLRCLHLLGIVELNALIFVLRHSMENRSVIYLKLLQDAKNDKNNCREQHHYLPSQIINDRPEFIA